MAVSFSVGTRPSMIIVYHRDLKCGGPPQPQLGFERLVYRAVVNGHRIRGDILNFLMSGLSTWDNSNHIVKGEKPFTGLD